MKLLMKQLDVEFTDEERRASNVYYNDPDGWKHAEGVVRRYLTQCASDLVLVLRYVADHPDDPKIAELRALLRLVTK